MGSNKYNPTAAARERDKARCALYRKTEAGKRSKKRAMAKYKDNPIVKERLHAYSIQYSHSPKGLRQLVAYRLKKYGLTSGDYEGMLSAQGGKCALCGLPDVTGRRLAVDHSHATGRVRGLLCHRCNTGIGLLGDNPELLRRGAEYLDAAE
jgi:hypothetical protein